MKLLLLLVMVTVCAAAPQDLLGYMFTFPHISTDHVKLKASAQNFNAVTVCHRSFTDLQRDHALFSMSTPSSDKEVLISWEHRFKQFKLHFRGQHVTSFGWDYKPNKWHSICTTWDSTTGLVQMWFDGKPSVRQIISPGSKISGTPTIILGQDQNNNSKEFDTGLSFVGVMSDVNMWNHVLSVTEIVLYSLNMTLSWNENTTIGNVINWRALDYQIVGKVFLEDNSYCP